MCNAPGVSIGVPKTPPARLFPWANATVHGGCRVSMPIFKLSHVNRVYDASHIHGQASGPAVEPASPLRRDISEDEDDADSSSGSEVTQHDGSFTTVGPSVVGNSAAMQISTQVGADLRPLIAHHLSSSGVIEDSITPDDSISRVGGRAPSSLAGKSEVLKSKGRVPLSSLGRQRLPTSFTRSISAAMPPTFFRCHGACRPRGGGGARPGGCGGSSACASSLTAEAGGRVAR